MKVAVAAIVTVVGVVAAVANFVVIMPNSREVSVQNPLLQYIILIINKYSSPDFVLEVAERFQTIETSDELYSGLS